jgi:UDP-N-acetylglucosamine 2-epimerase (non-hydrolysing)
VALSRAYKLPAEVVFNPYGQGNSSAQVIEMIKTTDFDFHKSFYDLAKED